MTNGTVYCGDIPGAIFLKGNDTFDDLDIECDGANNHAGDCANDPTGQSQTAFKDGVSRFGIPDLDANVHPYVVFGNAEGFNHFREVGEYGGEGDGLGEATYCCVARRLAFL